MEKLSYKFLIGILIFINGFLSFGQEIDYQKGNFYTINEIKVSGLKSFNEQTVIAYTGLSKGQNIRIPGEEISQVINKLWKLELFSDINFYLTNVEGDKANIEISIKELGETIKRVIGFKGKVLFDTKKPEGTMRKLLDSSKVKILGWKPKIALEEGIKSAYLAFISQSDLSYSVHDPHLLINPSTARKKS